MAFRFGLEAGQLFIASKFVEAIVSYRRESTFSDSQCLHMPETIATFTLCHISRPTTPSPTACISRALRESISSSSSLVHTHTQDFAMILRHLMWLPGEQKHVLQSLLFQQINERHLWPGFLLASALAWATQTAVIGGTMLIQHLALIRSRSAANAAQMLRAIHTFFTIGQMLTC